jgi:hypothetical protein
VIKHLDLWERIVAPLCETPDIYVLPRGKQGSAARDSKAAVQVKCGNIAVQTVERQNDRAMLISWSDATRGHFAEQRWVSAKSRCRGRCVMTGDEIRRGDPIYKPQRGGAKCTAIGSGMILAAALERVAGACAGI